MLTRPQPYLTLLALAALLLPAVAAASASDPNLDGYEQYHRIALDLDRDGTNETATAYEWPEYSLDHPPHLVVRRGSRVLLDLWLKDTNVLIDGEGPPHGALQAGDLTGDGVPELLFVPMSAGGSGGTHYPRVARWNGKEFADLRLAGRRLNSISENGGATLKRGPGGKYALLLYDLEDGRRYKTQRFTFQRGQLLGDSVRRSRRSGKAGLKEMGVL